MQDSMLDEIHNLFYELPEHRETIEFLNNKNEHFARMFDEYHEINHEILLIENEEQPASDFYLEDKKKRRLQLKDQLYQMIQAV